MTIVWSLNSMNVINAKLRIQKPIWVRIDVFVCFRRSTISNPIQYWRNEWVSEEKEMIIIHGISNFIHVFIFTEPKHHKLWKINILNIHNALINDEQVHAEKRTHIYMHWIEMLFVLLPSSSGMLHYALHSALQFRKNVLNMCHSIRSGAAKRMVIFVDFLSRFSRKFHEKRERDRERKRTSNRRS